MAAECSVLTLQVLPSVGNLATNLTSSMALSLWGLVLQCQEVSAE